MRALLGWESSEGWLGAIRERSKISEGWLSVFLLVVIMLSTVWSVEAANWVPKLPSLTFISLAGLAFGVIFAKLHFRGLVLHPLAIVYGLGIVIWQTLSVMDLPSWEGRFVDLVLRLNAWGYAARSGGINTDSLVFGFTLVGLSWLIGYLSAWFVFRSHRIWWGVVPNGVAILTNLRYAPPNVAAWFALYLFAAMLLFIRLTFFLQEKKWTALKVKFSPRMSYSYLPVAVVICGVILAAAWVTPVGTASVLASDIWQSRSSPWQNFQGDFSRLFASLSSSAEDSFGGFGHAMVLKGPVSPGSNVTMVVTAEESHYWRATSYDTYVGRGWVNRDTSEVQVRPSLSLAFGRQYEQRKEITQTVSLRLFKDNLVLAAGQPLRLDQIAVAETIRVPMFTIPLIDRSQDNGLPPDIRRYAAGIRRTVERARDDGTLAAGQWPTILPIDLPPDVAVSKLVYSSDASTLTGVELMRLSPYPMDVVDLRFPQQAKKVLEYKVVSSVSIATERQLRTGGSGYPDWVLQRYLQIPTGFPGRVGELAQSLTKDATNPFDKAIAIQDYLRKLKYNQRIEIPPANVDPVDYFIFTLKEGYCDYYASAMVMMLRTIGIPARVATGFQPGTPDSDKGSFVVRQSNVHAWPEVYFARFGWIEFEPTASIDPLPRPADDETAEPIVPVGSDQPTGDENIEDPFFDETLSGDSSGQSQANTLSWTAGTIALLSLILTITLVWLLWQKGLSKLTLPFQVYEKMCRLAGFAGNGPLPSQTPYEYSRSLGLGIPDSASDVERIATAYTSIAFGRKRLVGESREIERAWRRVRNRLLRKIVTRK
ncbi:MAG: transglutaminase domain-containing protein [Dehalococcoidia bacterium]|nr:transglutaminase domain-containing protein [Dehalococcoidia bacterium]